MEKVAKPKGCVPIVWICEGCGEHWHGFKLPEEYRVLVCDKCGDNCYEEDPDENGECGGRCFAEMAEGSTELILEQSTYGITIDIHPCYKFRTVGSDKQLLQIASEFSEVVKAVESGNPTESAYECADLVIATVGYMRFVLGLSETEIADIFQLMNEKNKSRGYLDEVSNQ